MRLGGSNGMSPTVIDTAKIEQISDFYKQIITNKKGSILS